MMMPDLQSNILCDDIRQEFNGKFIIIGMFDAVGSPTYPLVFQRLCVVNRWCCGEGTFSERTRIVGPDKNQVVAEGQSVPIKLPNPECSATNIQFFVNLQFPSEGVYYIEVLLNDDLKLRYPLRANRVNPPPARKGPETPPAPGG